MLTNIKDWYAYEPVKAVSIAACVLFAVGLILHIWQTWQHKAWIWIVMVFAVAMEAFGYGVRVASVSDVSNQPKFVTQYVLIVMSPVLMTGIIYVVFGRIVFHVVPREARTTKLLWVPARFLTPIFVGFDVIALCLQCIGAIMIAATSPTDAKALNKLKKGRTIALVGVSVQIAAFGLFSIIAFRFHFTSRRFKAELEAKMQRIEGEKMVTLPGSTQKFRPGWESVLWAVNGSCALILVRSIYREVEFGQGKFGYSNTHEWVQYCFDTLPMLLLTFLYTLFPPGRYVQMSFKQTKGSKRADSHHSSDAEVVATENHNGAQA